MSTKKFTLPPYMVIEGDGYHYPAMLKDGKTFYFVSIRTGKRRRYATNASACYFCANHSMPSWSTNAVKYKLVREEKKEGEV